jgi:hypothetical protein
MGGDHKHDAKPAAAAAPAAPGSVEGLYNPYAASLTSPLVANIKKGLFYGGLLSVGTALSKWCRAVAAA